MPRKIPSNDNRKPGGTWWDLVITPVMKKFNPGNSRNGQHPFGFIFSPPVSYYFHTQRGTEDGEGYEDKQGKKKEEKNYKMNLSLSA